MKQEVPNLEGLDDTELWEFWRRYQHGSNHVELVGADRTSSKLAAEIALTIYTARGLRVQGKIQRAMVYERHVDDLMWGLPQEMRW